MLAEAASWRPDGPHLDAEEARADPQLARYLAGWGREGDLGFVAEVEDAPVGAAWWRFFDKQNHGYGFIAREIPELSIAVAEIARRRGIGTALLQALLEEAHRLRVSALSLSVESDNPAVRLYERVGFTRVAQVDNAWTMRAIPSP